MKFIIWAAAILAVFGYVILGGPQGVEAAIERLRESRSSRQNNLVRQIIRTESTIRACEQIIKAQNLTLDWQQSTACANGLDEYCAEPEPDPVISPGHTISVSFDVRASAYNNLPGQTDSSPCIGSFGANICDAADRGEIICAASRDIVTYPLGYRAKLRIRSRSTKPECMPYDGKVCYVMDTMADCLSRDKITKVTRRGSERICPEAKKIKESIDVFMPCSGDPESPRYCVSEVQKAKDFGHCNFNINKI